MDQAKLSIYDEIKSKNIIGAVKHLLRQDVLELRHSDGKLMPCHLKNTWETPWSHHKLSYRSNCYMWKDIFFHNLVQAVLPVDKWFVPRHCQDCYKVVVRPPTLKALFALEKLQYKLDHASKCGVEIRDTVFGLYGGYFYNRGLDEGLACYKMVKKAVNEDPALGDIPVLLKRACTEMEDACGDSDKWEVTPEAIQLEELVEQYFVMDIPVVGQTDHAKRFVHQTWIEKAYKWGDPTSLEYFDGGNTPGIDYVTYHHLVEQGD